MPERDILLYLEDIKDSCEKILKYTDKTDYKSFFADDMKKDAVVRNLEIIGEAVKKLPKELMVINSNIEWKKIAGLRDIIVHHYFGINEGIIWDVVINKIPDLLKVINRIIESSYIIKTTN